MRALVLAMTASLVLAGCADPYAERPRAPNDPVAGEQPASPVRKPDESLAAEGLAHSPEGAVRQAVELSGNWTAETIGRNHERLAASTTGQARRDAQRTAAQATTDPQLTAPGAKSIAILHAVVPRAGGPNRRLLVVTHETLTADGVRQTRFRVTLAEAQKLGDGWVLSRWEPQP
jgi:hypothetical protein